MQGRYYTHTLSNNIQAVHQYHLPRVRCQIRYGCAPRDRTRRSSVGPGHAVNVPCKPRIADSRTEHSLAGDEAMLTKQHLCLLTFLE